MNWKNLINIIASTVLPLIYPPLAPAVPFIIHGIQTAENAGGTGAQKLQQAVDIAVSGAQATNQIVGKTLIDIPALSATVADGINTVVNATNIIAKATPSTVVPSTTGSTGSTGSVSTTTN